MKNYLTICDGEYVQQEVVFEWFKKQAEKYEILGIGYDLANALWLTRMLESQGFACQIIRQGPLTMNDPMKDMKELLMDGRVISNQDAMLRWYMHNVRLRNNYNDREKENWMPVKKNRYRKIDGFMAMLDAHALMMQRNPVENVDSEIGVTVYSLR